MDDITPKKSIDYTPTLGDGIPPPSPTSEMLWAERIRAKNSQAPAFSLRIEGGAPAVALPALRHNWSGSAGEVTADGSGPADVMACSGSSELEGIRSTGPLQSESCGGVRGTISPVRLLAHVC